MKNKWKEFIDKHLRGVHVWILRSIWPCNLTLNKTSYIFFFTIEQFFFENNCMPINSFNNFSTFICSKLHSLRVYQNGNLWTKTCQWAKIDIKQSTTEQLFYLSRNLLHLISSKYIYHSCSYRGVLWFTLFHPGGCRLSPPQYYLPPPPATTVQGLR